jgi:hypothetical protein
MNRNDILKTSYLNQKEAANKFNNAGYKYDDSLSSNDAKVFIDENGQPNIAFRSTHKLRFKDLKSDLALRANLSLARDSKTSYVYDQTSGNEVSSKLVSSFGLGLHLGAEKHFLGTDRLDPYAGADLIIGMGNTSSKISFGIP